MTTLDLTPTPFTPFRGTLLIRADIFPANVAFSSGPTMEKVRALVTEDEVMILADGHPTPNLVYSGRLEDVNGTARSYTVVTEDAELTITRGGGCGCGSKLRSYRPYGRAIRMANP